MSDNQGGIRSPADARFANKYRVDACHPQNTQSVVAGSLWLSPENEERVCTVRASAIAVIHPVANTSIPDLSQLQPDSSTFQNVTNSGCRHSQPRVTHVHGMTRYALELHRGTLVGNKSFGSENVQKLLPQQASATIDVKMKMSRTSRQAGSPHKVPSLLPKTQQTACLHASHPAAYISAVSMDRGTMTSASYLTKAPRVQELSEIPVMCGDAGAGHVALESQQLGSHDDRRPSASQNCMEKTLPLEMLECHGSQSQQHTLMIDTGWKAEAPRCRYMPTVRHSTVPPILQADYTVNVDQQVNEDSETNVKVVPSVFSDLAVLSQPTVEGLAQQGTACTISPVPCQSRSASRKLKPWLSGALQKSQTVRQSFMTGSQRHAARKQYRTLVSQAATALDPVNTRGVMMDCTGMLPLHSPGARLPALRLHASGYIARHAKRSN